MTVEATLPAPAALAETVSAAPLPHPPAPLLETRDLVVQYRTDSGIVAAVDRVSFAVPQGAMVGLVGESGCGKTTLARAITRVLPGNATIAAGQIMFRGEDLVALPEAAMQRLRWTAISFVPQSAMSSLDPVYRIEGQIGEVLARRGGIRHRRERRDRALALLAMVGLGTETLRAYPHELSGGMRQRAAIALALALDPQLVIADEPVTALDVIVQREVLDTLRGLQRRLGVSVIMVTHDISVVAYCCDVVVVMYAGRIVEAGPVAAVLGEPAHPYTMGLYNAFPDLARSAGTLVPIPGDPPDLHAPPSGCRFAPRCPFALDQCRRAPPPLIALDAAHQAACWRSDEAPVLREQAAMAATWQQ